MSFRASQKTIVRTLIVFLLLGNIVVITVSLAGLKRFHENAIHEAETRSENIALAVDLAISNEVSKIDLSLRTVVNELLHHSESGDSGDPAYVGALIAQQKSLLPETEAWSITDADGLVTHHESKTGASTFSVVDRDYFKKLKADPSDRLLVSKPLVGRMSGNPIIVFARALKDTNGKFSGTVVVPLPVSYFNTALSEFDVGDKGLLALRDIDHEIITRVISYDKGVSFPITTSKASKEFKSVIASGKTRATYSGTTLFDNEPRIFSYRIVSNAPIYAHVGISKSQSLSEWRSLTWQVAIYLSLILLLANGSAWLIYRHWKQQQSGTALLKESNERLEHSLQQLEERDSALRAAQDAGHLATYNLNIPSGLWTSSEALDGIFGIDPLFPRTIESWRQLVHPEDQDSMSRYFTENVIGNKQIFDREYRISRPDNGRTVWVHGLGKLDLDHHGQPVRMGGTIQDISERKFAEERLQLTGEVFQNASEGILVTDHSGTIIETNPAFTIITGFSAADARGRTPRILKSGLQDSSFYQAMWGMLLKNGHWKGIFYNRRKDERLYVQQSHITAIRDDKGSITRFVAVISDITELKESQQRLEHMAYHDVLTGLPNRAHLTKNIQRAMIQCQRASDSLLGLCCLDLDGFKTANDRWGHEVGDQLLTQVAQRLNACTRGNDMVARMGGDEFVVLLCELKDENDGIETVSRLMKRIAEPYHVGSVRESITVSVGMTLYPKDNADDPDMLLRHADLAMYEAKHAGKNRLHLFDLDSDRIQKKNEEQYYRVANAFEHDELRLFYQPKIDFRSGKIVGVEALIRWQHPELGLVQPMDFLPAIEGTDLTVPVGEWILREALRQKRAWQEEGIHVHMSVNIFARHLQQRDFAEHLENILNEFPTLEPEELELEILETTSFEDLQDLTKTILQCREFGVQFSLDDFGTGYSSLTYLRQLPVTKVKIDRSFVRDMLTNPDDHVLVKGIVGMSKTLGRLVVAEGLETMEHGIPLIRHGCDWGQGYGIARPMDPAAFPAWYRHWTLPDSWHDAIKKMSVDSAEAAH